jgi:hypothetical protein
MSDEEIGDVQHTGCGIVGGGPGGAVLALLLARCGVPVTLLEMHKDFDRDFRGDTIHPTILQILDEIGLAERLLQLPHGKQRVAVFQTADGPVKLIDFSRAGGRWPYIVMMPQVQFLEFITEEAKRFPSFRLVLGANVQRLIEEGGAVRGVRYRWDDGWHELRAQLIVGPTAASRGHGIWPGSNRCGVASRRWMCCGSGCPKSPATRRIPLPARSAAVAPSRCSVGRQTGSLRISSPRADTSTSGLRAWASCAGPLPS